MAKCLNYILLSIKNFCLKRFLIQTLFFFILLVQALNILSPFAVILTTATYCRDFAIIIYYATSLYCCLSKNSGKLVQ